MKTTAHSSGKNFTLTAETQEDQLLIDAIHLQHSVLIHGFERAAATTGPGQTNAAVNLLVDNQSPQALEAQTGRQLLRAVRELFRLGLGEHALNSHIGLDTANPQTQDKIAALFKQFQLMLDLGSLAIGQPKTVGKEIDTTHARAPFGNETAIVEQQGGAA